MANEARQQAQAERLTLVVAENKAGYFGVTINQSSKSRPYQAKVKCVGKDVHLGYFATAEEAALCVARSPEGQTAASAAKKAAATPAPATGQEEGKHNPSAVLSSARTRSRSRRCRPPRSSRRRR